MGHMLLEKVAGEDLRSYRIWLEHQLRTKRQARVRKQHLVDPKRSWTEKDEQAVLATTHHNLGDVLALLRWCEETGLIDRAPTPRRLRPRLKERPPDCLTDEEAACLSALPEPHGFVIRLGIGTGLRWEELCRAQAADVRNGALGLGYTKSGKVRRIPLEPELLRDVRSRVGRLVAFSPKSPGSFNKTVRRRSGIKRFHVHMTRHTFGCRWVERGGSLAALQELLGHASITTTMRYARLADDLVRREVERLAAASG